MGCRRDCNTGDWRETGALSAPGAEAPGLHSLEGGRLAWPAVARLRRMADRKPSEGWRARPAFAPPELRRGTNTHAPSRHSSRGRVKMGGERERRRMARPAGLEPAAPGLEGRCSIRLSYGRSRRAARILYDGFYFSQGISTRNALPSMSFAVTVTRLAFTLRALNGTLSRSEKRLWARTRFSPFSIRAMMVEK